MGQMTQKSDSNIGPNGHEVKQGGNGGIPVLVVILLNPPNHTSHVLYND
jgi:hypothetical protein